MPEGAKGEGEAVEPKLTPQQMQALEKLVTKHDENVVEAWADPVKEVAGAMLYQARNCG